MRASVLRTLACSGLEPECNPANYKLRVANFHIKISHQLSYGTVQVCSRNGRLVATMSFEKGDVSSSPTDDAAPEGEPRRTRRCPNSDRRGEVRLCENINGDASRRGNGRRGWLKLRKDALSQRREASD